MRRGPLLAPFAWGVATAVASVVSWLGVGAVTRAVTAAPEPVIPAQSVVARHPDFVLVPPPVGQLVAATPTTTTTTEPLIVVHAPSPNIVVPTTVVPSGSSTTTTSSTQAPTTTTTTNPGTPVGKGPPPPPKPETVTFSDAGGQMTATCTGIENSFDSAVPNDGYTVTIENKGPVLVEVYFSKGKKVLVLESDCVNGVPQPTPPGGWGVNPGQSGPNPGQF
jgi:hypothetical protein